MKFFRFLLFPFAIIYDAITTIRNIFFDVGIFKQTSFKIPIIIVGNLSVGGTGKTPQIEYLIRLLHNHFKVSVLSRGYKRKTKGFVFLNNSHAVLDVGDEPLQYFKKFKNIHVAVDANRVEGIQKLIDYTSAELILLDDAYQHRKVKGSFYILLTKFDDLFTDDFLLPTGNLRESRRGAKRANVIIVTKCPAELNHHQKQTIKRKLEKYQKEIFFTTISYGAILSSKNTISIDELKEYKILLITGIANPNSLLAFLNDKNIDFKHNKFADHHNFLPTEIENIQQEFDAITSAKRIILTTEKDFVRLEKNIENLYYIPIETNFLENQKWDFDKVIRSHIQQNRF